MFRKTLTSDSFLEVNLHSALLAAWSCFIPPTPCTGEMKQCHSEPASTLLPPKLSDLMKQITQADLPGVLKALLQAAGTCPMQMQPLLHGAHTIANSLLFTHHVPQNLRVIFREDKFLSVIPLFIIQVVLGHDSCGICPRKQHIEKKNLLLSVVKIQL